MEADGHTKISERFVLNPPLVPDRKADGEKEDDGGWEVEAEDDHAALVHGHPGEGLGAAEADPGDDGHRVDLTHEEGGEREQRGQHQGEEEQQRRHPALLPHRDHGGVQPVQLKIVNSNDETIKKSYLLEKS